MASSRDPSANGTAGSRISTWRSKNGSGLRASTGWDFHSTTMLAPTFEDIVAAREFISPYLPKTPLVRVDKISDLLDCDYYAKLENLQPTGAFKVRGGVNLVGNDVGTGSGRGRVDPPTLITATTGNHGQSIAYAGRLFGARDHLCARRECERIKDA